MKYLIEKGSDHMKKKTLKKFYNLKYDLVFKNVLFDGSDLELSNHFLSKVLRKEIEVLRIENTELPNQKVSDKNKHVDVLLYTTDGYYHLEMNPKNAEYLHERNFAYACNIISQKSLKGSGFSKTKYTQINFTFGLKSDGESEVYNVQSIGQKQFVQNFEIIEINMDTVMKYWYTQNEREIEKYKYLIILDLGKKELKEITKEDKYLEKIRKGVERMNSEHRFVALMSRDEDMKRCHYMDINIAKRDGRLEGLYEGRIEGRLEGMEEGKNTEKIETVKRMYRNNLSIDDISTYCELSIDKVKAILRLT